MRQSGRTLVWTTSVLLVGAARPPSERVVTGDGVVAASVAGVPGRVRIDPGATALPILTADFAGRAKLHKGLISVVYSIGPMRVHGATVVADTAWNGGRPARQRVAWVERPYAAGLDGVIGPAGLPEQVIRFALHEPRPEETVVRFPISDQGGPFGGLAERFATIQVGGRPMRVRFDPHHPRTLATAAAAVRIAAAQGGTLSTRVTQAEIAFGIERPVRELTLVTPLRLGPLTIATLGVRTADGGSASPIPEEGADPDEVIVVAGRRGSPVRDRLSLGADQLSRCSSIVFDKHAREVTLSCM